jgi:hypothetical protein
VVGSRQRDANTLRSASIRKGTDRNIF